MAWREPFSHREKVAAEQPDEGMLRLSILANAASPHPSPSATPSPYGRGALPRRSASENPCLPI
jgi:hypothetical protein